jgi:hypothetical protein
LSPISGKVFSLVDVSRSSVSLHPYRGRDDYYLGLVAQSESDIAAKHPSIDQHATGYLEQQDSVLPTARNILGTRLDLQKGAVGEVNDSIASLG